MSPLFLNYINKGLDFYKDDPKVFSICGFSPFILGDNYFSENILYKNHEWNAWGFGTWKSKLNTFRNFRKSSEIFLDIKTNLKSRLFRSKLNDLSFEYYPHLLNSLKKNKKPEFDYCAGYYCLANNFFNIYPTQSFTINTGNDGSGLRVKKNDEIASKMKPENFSNKILLDYYRLRKKESFTIDGVMFSYQNQFQFKSYYDDVFSNKVVYFCWYHPLHLVN